MTPTIFLRCLERWRYSCFGSLEGSEVVMSVQFVEFVFSDWIVKSEGSVSFISHVFLVSIVLYVTVCANFKSNYSITFH